MGLLQRVEDVIPPGEPIRLVIWDLDETLWLGTQAEGEVRPRAGVRDIVITLSRRGVVNSICSKNDFARAQATLEAFGLWEYFIFPSINWEPKGQRLRALLEAIQLRPDSALFIDDNHGNRAEAQHYVRGLRVASDAAIPHLTDSVLLRGKDDPGLSRLKQYRLLQNRKEAQTAAGDSDDFLRDSRIEVFIDHDIDQHLDRAIELINRTNQLNFTKIRLPEDIDAARAALRASLASHFIKAGILSVRDRYGDYGWVGFYMLHHQHAHSPRLVHFCFSCRILNMGVETWLYERLGRPALKVAGEVLVELAAGKREIDWIGLGDGRNRDSAAATRKIDYVLLRGGCDIHTIAHYFRFTGADVFAELHSIRDGVEPTLSHSIMLRHALAGSSAEFRAAAAPFGYVDEDFASVAANPPEGRGVWLFSFSHDNMSMLYRFKPTGELLPVRSYKTPDVTRTLIGGDPEALGLSAKFLGHLEQWFEFHGRIGEELFESNLRLLFSRAPSQTKIFVVLGNELMAGKDGNPRPNGVNIQRNSTIRKAAEDFPNVAPIAVTEFLPPSDKPQPGDHWDRRSYFRLFELILARVENPTDV